MHIRDGRTGDESGIRAHASGDVDPTHLLRERTVRVAGEDDDSAEDSGDGAAIAGFLAFQVLPDAVHVTRLGGTEAALAALVEDVSDLANREALPVEAVVPTGDEEGVALETRGFEVVGRGPRFRGRETTRFRLDTV